MAPPIHMKYTWEHTYYAYAAFVRSPYTYEVSHAYAYAAFVHMMFIECDTSYGAYTSYL